MNANEFLELFREAVFILLMMAAPAMLMSLLVGLMISLFQALTQIQETTLTFVPKIITMFLTITLAMPFMLDMLITFAGELFERIANIN